MQDLVQVQMKAPDSEAKLPRQSAPEGEGANSYYDSSRESFRCHALPRAAQDAIAQVDDAGSKEQMHTAAIRYDHRNPDSLGFSAASSRVVMADTTVGRCGQDSSQCLVRVHGSRGSGR